MSLLNPQLQAFVAIVKHNTVHAAAVQLHITQTAVTQRIRALEQSLQTTLFVRTRRGMLLTPEGEALLRYCQAAQDLEGEALANIKGAAGKTEVRVTISGPTSIMRSRIIPQCLPVLRAFPKLLLSFEVTDEEDRHQHLKAGKCQFAIIQKEDVAREMSCKLLKPEQYVLVCAHTWKDRKLKEIIKNERIIDFGPSDQLTFAYLKHYDLFDLVQHERHFVNRTESLAMMVCDGFGYGLLAKEFAKPYINSGKMMVLNAGRMYEHTMALAWYARPEPPAYFSALIAGIE